MMINSQYRSVITSAGHTANTQSIASGTTIVFDEIAFGSGGLVPNENATGLIKEELRIKIHSVVQNQTDTNILEIEAVVPAHIGGFTINEAALYLDDGTLYAVASLPESYKPILDQGAGKEFSFVFFLASVGVENVALTIDGGASFVTTNYFQNELKKYAFVIGDETKKFKVADAQAENEAVNKKQIDELETRLNVSIGTINDSIETINDSIETINNSVGKNTTTAVSGANPVTGNFGTGKINFYVSDDTFIVPEGITSVRVRLWGAGNQGGGGGFALKAISDLVPGVSIPITVGVAAGATSSFGAYVSATGGTANSTSIAGIGGTGIGGDINHSGGSNPTNPGGIISGCGGAGNLFGNGGNGGNGGSSYGATGSSAASGGGGGSATSGTVNAGGNGGSGLSGEGGRGGAYATGTNYASLLIAENGKSSFDSIDFIGTGGGGGGKGYIGSGGAGTNGGGGGSGGPGGFPGGGGSPHGIGLVIVEW
ncbi:phage tail protein [Aliarcobacter cryaerophilus]|uniref:Phage tail protein n=2 Tax=unclassified Arcobacter TaxID=2593671 RepID=A0AA96I5Z6_9BACT|nr:phage tail protein [Arcobacter sp. AZ-2023]WPD10339.1 phage tail protein [Arcobacter sp. DSM 115954]WNL15169.1 phage tail protein [Arcobacter sp. AZ-2023]WNL18949.1 phage tail protein [Arcobacter sp. AZ-2023]WNL21088.1 phage tail protein [Arcobacter sp. AZ-2023]